jgi:hypothetical protein
MGLEGNAMSSKKIPTPEEFARASRLAAERSRGLDQVRQGVLERFCGRCPLHEFYILDQLDVDFRAYVFFERTADISACQQSGINAEIVDFVYAELDRLGRGPRDRIKVAFEFDSDENVTTHYEGNYFLRLK